jgi:hypothetical protein
MNVNKPRDQKMLFYQILNEVLNGFHIDNLNSEIGMNRDQLFALWRRVEGCEALFELRQDELSTLRRAAILTMRELAPEFATRTGFSLEEVQAMLDLLATTQARELKT